MDKVDKPAVKHVAWEASSLWGGAFIYNPSLSKSIIVAETGYYAHISLPDG